MLANDAGVTTSAVAHLVSESSISAAMGTPDLRWEMDPEHLWIPEGRSIRVDLEALDELVWISTTIEGPFKMTFDDSPMKVFIDGIPASSNIVTTEGPHEVLFQFRGDSAYSRTFHPRTLRISNFEIGPYYDSDFHRWFSEKSLGQSNVVRYSMAGDMDKDGASNFLEFLLGDDPYLPGVGLSLERRFIDGQYFWYSRFKYDGDHEALRFEIEASDDLKYWVLVEAIGESETADGATYRVLQSVQGVETIGKAFARIKLH